MQHSFTFDGLQTLANVENDLNDALQSLASLSSGDIEPNVTFAYQLWVDTSGTTPWLKIRNGNNNGWISAAPVVNNLGFVAIVDDAIASAFSLSPSLGQSTINTVEVPDSSDRIASTLYVKNEGDSRLRLLTSPTVNFIIPAVAQWFDVDYSIVFATSEYSEGVFTVGTTGYYRIAHSLVLIADGGTPPSFSQAISGFSIDDKNYTGIATANKLSYVSPSSSHLFYLTAGQKIKAKVYCDSVGGEGYTTTLLSSQKGCFSIERII